MFSSRNRAGSTRLAGLVTASALVLALLASPAAAFPDSTNNCNDSTLSWHFNSDSLWTSEKKTWVRAGFNTIDNALDDDGTKLVTLTEVTSGGISVDLQYLPASTTNGSSECDLGDADIWINSKFTEAKTYYHVARHEMLHLAGAEHGGQNDSRNGDTPSTMATCFYVSTARSINSLDQDSAQYLQYLHGTLSSGYRDITANLGFEQGTSFWGVSGGTLNVYTPGGATGTTQAGFFPDEDDLEPYTFQTTRTWTGSETGVRYRVVMNAKRSAPDLSTEGEAQLYWRELSDGASNGCSYPDGIDDPNTPPLTLTTSWSKKASTDLVTQGNSWLTSSSPWYTMSSPHDGHELQVRIRALVEGNHSIRLDNVRIQRG